MQHAEAQLEVSQAAFGKLCNDHQQLQEVRRHEEREGYELSELFRRQLLSKNEQLASMQAEVSAAVTRLQETEAAAAQREAQLKQDFEAERQQMGAAVAAVRAELAAVAQYRQGKQELEQELHRLRSDKVGIAEALGEKVRTLQRRLYELGFGADGLGEGSKAAASDDEEATTCLEADLHRLLAHSRKVEGEIRLYGQVSTRQLTTCKSACTLHAAHTATTQPVHRFMHGKVATCSRAACFNATCCATMHNRRRRSCSGR